METLKGSPEPLPPDLAELQGRFKELKDDPQLFQTFMANLGKTVKRDETVKGIVFLTGLSAYSKDPINLFLRGPSSTGKTYNVTESLKYFPPTDVWMLGGLSPTALVHDYGVLIDPETASEIELEDWPQKGDFGRGKDFDREAWRQASKEWKEKLRRSHYLVDLQRKILAFLEAPHPETYMRLRPILSHDVYEIHYRFTDKTGKGALRTMHVVLRGWPAAIFCTTEVKYVEDLATRGFTVTPEMGRTKYSAAVELEGEKRSQPWRFNDDPGLKPLSYFVQVLRDRPALGNRVVIPYAQQLSKIYPATLPRDMRDFKHFLSLIEKSCLLHVFQRPSILLNGTNYFMATMKDFMTVLELLKDVEETTRSGISGHIIGFFHRVILPVSEDKGLFRCADLVEKQAEVGDNPLSSKTIENYVGILEDIGWVDREPDPEDKRVKLIRVLKKPENTPYYSLGTSLPFFSQEDFKNWLESLKNYSRKNSIFVYKNYLKEEADKVDLGLDDDVKDSCVKEIYFREYFLEPLKPEMGSEGENKPENIPKEYKGIISTFSLDQVKSITGLNPPYEEKCHRCGEKRVLYHQVETFTGGWGHLCQDCGAKLQGDLEKRRPGT